MAATATKATAATDCVRQIANWSGAPTKFRFDAAPRGLPRGARRELEEQLPVASPKLDMLFRNIERLDARDWKRDGRRYKHMVFTDVRSNYHGAKLVATAFEAKGYARVMTPSLDLSPARLRALEDADGETGNSFGLLCSSTVYRKAIPARYKKELVRLYNLRPDNVYGELVRFIILDQGYKEGIDLYDIRYVHLLEPLLTPADEVQAIGRGTRYCGQNGLPFHPKRGWPLYVYRYDLSIPERLKEGFQDAQTLGDLAFRLSGKTLAQVALAGEVDYLTQFGAVDYPLTRAIHDSDVLGAAAAEASLGGAGSAGSAGGGGGAFGAGGAMGGAGDEETRRERGRVFRRYDGYLRRLSRKQRAGVLAMLAGNANGDEMNAGAALAARQETRVSQALSPATRRGFLAMRALVSGRFAPFAWPEAAFENICAPSGGARPVVLSPSQEFLRRYFTPASWYKGLLVYHLVGTGKTCSAIATASSSWEQEGYTILWVTRHTLKADMWKNMYDVVCSSVIREQLESGKLKLPEEGEKVRAPKRYLSKAWLSPISYKQFSNLLADKNELHAEMVRRNGAADPLRRTLVIIDEAHKLLAEDLRGGEVPDTALIREMIHRSYERSGRDSVRLMLLTATPFNADPIDLCRLLNLLRPRDQAMPEDLDGFRARYLDGDLHFTERGTRRFLDDISGYVSYLNRQKDARAFAYPVVRDMVEPMPASTVAEHRRELAEVQDLLARAEGDLGRVQEARRRVAASAELELAAGLGRCSDIEDAAARARCEREVRERVREYKRAMTQEARAAAAANKEQLADFRRAVRDARARVREASEADVSTERGVREKCLAAPERGRRAAKRPTEA